MNQMNGLIFVLIRLFSRFRSRTHGTKLQGVDSQPDDETSIGSDQDQEISSSGSDVVRMHSYHYTYIYYYMCDVF